MTDPADALSISRGERLLRRRDVQEKTSLSSTTIHRYMQTEGFPRPVRLGPNCSRWLESEVNEWINRLVSDGRER